MKIKLKTKFLEELTKVPIIQVACEKVGISRQTFYRWKNQSKKFSLDVNKAMEEGVNFVNDMSETQLLNPIKDKEFKAISFWLRNRSANYREKVEVTNMSQAKELTSEQKSVIKNALNNLKL